MRTIGERFGPAVKVQTQGDADALFAILVGETMGERPDLTEASVEAMVRSDLGYYAGYYDEETRERVERLFRCVHPILGSVHAPPKTARELLIIGKAWGDAHLRGEKFPNETQPVSRYDRDLTLAPPEK